MDAQTAARRASCGRARRDHRHRAAGGGRLYGGWADGSERGAGGWYLDSSHNRHAFMVSERNGRWGTAIEIPGTQARSWVNSVSCGSAGNCAADGGYIGNSGSIRPFVASEQDGRWAAIEVPGMASLISSIPGHGGNTEVSAASCLNGYCLPGAMSCLSTGYCLAGGYYDDYFGRRQAFVVSRP
jgi:hypothetical protein